MIGFWGVTLLLGTLNRMFHLFVHWKWPTNHYRNRCHPISSGTRGIFNRIQTTFRKYLIVPALFGYRHQQPLGWCTIPTRLQSLLLFVFVIINVLVCSMSYQILPPKVYGRTSSNQLFRLIADRNGVIACANFPLLWLFASRNDVFLWLTGWNYATFNTFHRWVARIVTLHAIIHGIGHTVTKYWDGGAAELAADYKERYFWCGVIVSTYKVLLLQLPNLHSLLLSERK